MEISPVLAGAYEAQDYVPPNPIASNTMDESAALDSRRYTKFDRSATEAGSTTDFSFSDFIDMINPLQHIPVLSSIYREIVGEPINPVARVSGDLLYGALMGGATAVLGGLGSVGDVLMEGETGKDATGNVVAALFGAEAPGQADAAVQLAKSEDASVPELAPTAQLAEAGPGIAPLQDPASAVNLAGGPALSPAQGKYLAAQIASQTAATADKAIQSIAETKGFLLDPTKKLPFGGVLDPAALQGTNLSLAMANSAPGLQLGQTVYPHRLTPGTRTTLRPATPSAVAAGRAPVLPSVLGAAPISAPASAPRQTNPLPPELMQDLASLRAITQYKNTASKSAPLGSSVDIVN